MHTVALYKKRKNDEVKAIMGGKILGLSPYDPIK